MSRVVVLDAGPLGVLCSTPTKLNVIEGLNWFSEHRSAGKRMVIPEIADYEVRRELLRLGKTESIERLDDLALVSEYVELPTATMRLAAELWAQARQAGKPTAGDKTIDADVILTAQTRLLAELNVIIATTNVKHLARFTAAEFRLSITV